MKILNNEALERLSDIRGAIQNARDDVGSLNREEFLTDGKTQRAVIESIAVIGEASNALMKQVPEFAHEDPELWRHLRDVADMRNFLIHRYGQVDPTVVWRTLVSDLPELEQLMRNISKQNIGDRSDTSGSLPPGKTDLGGSTR